MRHRWRGLVAAAAALALPVAGGCSHGSSKPKENPALFLTLDHSSLAGDVSKLPDDQLLAIGRRSCRDLDKELRPDEVVADISEGAEPGSARYNGYAFVAASAARALCPEHSKDFSGQIPGSSLDG